MLLRQSDFWEEESEAPLLGRDEGFLEQQGAEIFERVRRWPSLAGLSEAEQNAQVEWPSLDAIHKAHQRIVQKDAERTFMGEKQRERMAKLLTALIHRFQDYQQGLGYVAGFLLLTMEETHIYNLLHKFNNDPKYIYMEGYWKAEAVGFAVDAQVFHHVVQKLLPDVAKRLEERYILPETYCQKWFVGLNIHVLPFAHLFDFFELYLRQGHLALFQFGLSLLEQLKDRLLAAKQVSDIHDLLRLDEKLSFVDEELIGSIMAGMSRFEAPLKEQFDFAALREHYWQTTIKPRVDRAKKAMEEIAKEEDEAQEDSEEGEEDEDEDEDDDTGACQVCEESVPERYCKECQKLLCDACHEEEKDGHKKSHPSTEDWSEIEELLKAK
ncbi:TBC1 domain member 4 [Balamuthia mandrillaris]